MLIRYSLVLICLLFSLSGCAINKALTFPNDSERVIVTVKGHSALAVRPIKIGYRSEICTITNYTSDLKPYQKAAYTVISRKLIREESYGLYSVDIPVDGGGACKWRLGYIVFGVDYKDYSRFWRDVVPGAAEVHVLFDDNGGPRGRGDLRASGDLVIREDYYVWMQEQFVGGYRRYGGLIRNGEMILSYEAPQARHVYFEPVVHSKYPVFTKGPAVKTSGAHTSHTYPDGSTVETRNTRPDFQKLQCIRLPAECKQ